MSQFESGRQLIVRSALTLFLFLLISLAAFNLAGRAFVSSLARDDSAVLNPLSAWLGNEVKASSVELGWGRLSPWIRFRDVQIVTASGFSAIQIGLLEFDINLWQSLIKASPVANLLRLEMADFQLVQSADGALGLLNGVSGVQIDLQPLADFVLAARNFEVANTRVRLASEVDFLTDREFDIHVNARKTHISDWAHLAIELTNAAVADFQTVALKGRFRGDIRDWEALTGDFTLATDRFDLAHWRHPVDLAGGQLQLATGAVRLNLKLHANEPDLAALHVDGYKGAFTGAKGEQLPLQSKRLYAQAVRSGQKDLSWQISLGDGLVGTVPLEKIQLVGQILERGNQRRTHWLRIDRGYTEYLRPLLLATDRLSPAAIKWLTEIKPIARVQQFYARIETAKDQPPRFALTTQVEGIKNEAFNAIPFIDGLNGRLLVFEAGGLFKLGDGAFKIHFPDLFTPVIPVQNASGEVTFSFPPELNDPADASLSDDPADASFFVHGRQICARSDYGVLRGAFSVSNPHDEKLRTLSLQIGLDEIAPLQQALSFLPIPLPDDFKNWFTGALRSGRLLRGGVIYHDHLQADPDHPFDLSSLGLLWDFLEMRFEYDDKWPVLSVPAGRAHVTETTAIVAAPFTDVFGVELTNVFMSAPFARSPSAHIPIEVKARTSSSAETLMHFAKKTPARAWLDEEVLSWQVKGKTDMAIDIKVVVDLGKDGEAVFDDSWIALSGQIADTSLYLPSIELQFTDAHGDLTIHSDVGVFSEQMNFRVLDGNVLADISSNWRQAGSETVSIKLQGEAHHKALARWLEVPVIDLFEGRLAYQSALTIHLREETDIVMSLSSDMTGVRSSAPFPFNKKADESWPTTMQLSTTGDDQPIRLAVELAPDISILMDVIDGDISRGVVRLASDAEMHLPNHGYGLHIFGNLELVDVGDWVDYMDAVDQAYIALTGDPAAEAPNTVQSIKLQTTVQVGDFSFTDATMTMCRRTAQTVCRQSAQTMDPQMMQIMDRQEEKPVWKATIEASEGEGVLVIPDDDSLPIEITLERLSVVSDTATDGQSSTFVSDPLASVDFQYLTPMRVSIKSLKIDEEPYGSWSFSMAPAEDKENTIIFSNLHADIRGYTLYSDEDQPSTVTWTRTSEGDISSYKGFSRARNLGQILKDWDYEPVVDADRIQLETAVSWPGSPAMFDWPVLKGRVDARLIRGQVKRVSKSLSSLNKAIAVMDLSAWIRRLYLDFDDLVAEGIAFDGLTGSFFLDNNRVHVIEPVVMAGPGATLSFSGDLNLSQETVDGELIATLPLSKNLPWAAVAYGALASNPVTGLAALVFTHLFRGGFRKISSIKYEVSGDVSDPQIKQVAVFSARLKKSRMIDTTLEDKAEQTISRDKLN